MIEPEPIALYVTADDARADFRYWHVTLAPVHLAADGSPRNISQGYGTPEPLADLVILAQADADDPRPYGWETVYRSPYSVDRRTAETMARTLAKIERHLARLDTKYGPPADFSAYARRVADALGIDAYVIPIRRAATYTDGEYRHTDAAGAAAYITQRAQEYARAHAESVPA
jgi:hypothetical protein